MIKCLTLIAKVSTQDHIHIFTDELRGIQKIVLPDVMALTHVMKKAACDPYMGYIGWQRRLSAGKRVSHTLLSDPQLDFSGFNPIPPSQADTRNTTADAPSAEPTVLFKRCISLWVV